jgi:hypothetical protein
LADIYSGTPLSGCPVSLPGWSRLGVGVVYDEAMASSRRRSFLASVVGWIVVALIVYFFFGWILGTLRFVLRILVIVVVIGGLTRLYFKLRSDD